MINVIVSLILGGLVYFLLLKVGKMFDLPARERLIRGGAGFALVLVLNILALTMPALVALLIMLMCLAMMGYMIYWWRQDGSTIKELIHFAIIDLVIMLVANVAAMRVLDLANNSVVGVLMTTIPSIAWIGSMGFFIADMIWFRQELDEF